jgi:hypothetical protein
MAGGIKRKSGKKRVARLDIEFVVGASRRC